MSVIKKFFCDEVGLELSEYAVASFLIIVAIVAAIANVGSAIADKIATLAGFFN
jgi:Flp pilus assembly pilin Flp